LINKAVLFDRDGVINIPYYRNDISHPPESIDEVKFYEGVIESIIKINDAGFKTFIITNQPDVERGIVSKKTVDEINNHILSIINIDKLYVCYSSDNNHPDRKPNPGMLLKAAKEFDLDLTKSYVIGDRETDIIAGHDCGCKTILMMNHTKAPNNSLSDFRVENIIDATNIILGDIN
tara:strand:+ start:8160 stop:8690 length:531 start_codon:yes stop_codon:yes gene_type:complete